MSILVAHIPLCPLQIHMPSWRGDHGQSGRFPVGPPALGHGDHADSCLLAKDQACRTCSHETECTQENTPQT